MRLSRQNVGAAALAAVLTVGLVAILPVPGCGMGGSGWEFMGSPFYGAGGTTGGTTGPGTTTPVGGGGGGQSDRTPRDPCQEAQARKFVTISMRNTTPDYIHYFFVAIAFVKVDTNDPNAPIPFFDNVAFPNGAVCPNDIRLYQQFGYNIEIPAGQVESFGDYCVGGHALIYYHRSGQFRVSPGQGAAGLGSAIAPAQGTSPTYDGFFTSAGARMPVPDIILFHNPGGEGAALKVSRPTLNPCDAQPTVGAPNCARDSFYYVDEDDVRSGTAALGQGSARRVPSDIQGAGCQCRGTAQAFHVLAPSGVLARGATCQEFLRGGRIDYVFLRQDENPPFPQLVWRVTDPAGTAVHEYDPRAGIR